MKKLISILLLATFFGPQLAYADDFHQKGIWIVFPGDVKEEKVGVDREGLARYRIKQKAPARPASILVDTFIDIEDSDIYQRYGVEKGAESCLAGVATEITRSEVSQLTLPKSLQISGKIAMSFTMVHLGKFASDNWRDELVNRATYCIVEPTRTIKIQVIAPVAAPQEAYVSTLKSVENLKFVGKFDFYQEGVRIGFPIDFEKQKLYQARRGAISFLVRQRDKTDSSKAVVDSFIHVTNNGAYYERFGPEKGAEQCLMDVALRVSMTEKIEAPKTLQLAGKVAMRLTMTHSGRDVGDPLRDPWRNDTVNVVAYCIVEPTRKIEIQVIAPTNASEELRQRTLASIEEMKIDGK